MEPKDFIGFAGGVVAAVIGFALNQSLNRHRERKSKFEKLTSQLRAAVSEVEFTRDKIADLKEHFGYYKDNPPSARVSIPYYDFGLMANFLDHLKREFVAFPETSELAKDITALQFNLKQVQARLESLGDLLAARGEGFQSIEGTQRQAMRLINSIIRSRNLTDNISAMVELLEQVLTVSEKAVTSIAAHLKKVEGDFEKFKSDSTYNAVLKE